jgi:SAM-dependent methyltransferase
MRRKHIPPSRSGRILPKLLLVLLIFLCIYRHCSTDFYQTIIKDDHNSTSDCDGTHGSYLINRCICDPGYEGNNCSVPSSRRNIRCLVSSNDDICMNTERFGRLKVTSLERSREAQACETSFWRNRVKPMRNQDQALAFDSFHSLPQDLGHVVEVGAGPYTKIRLILEESNNQNHVQSITLVDPLLDEYMSNPNISTSYSNGKLCLPNESCIPTTLHSTMGESPLPACHFDTAILVNTLEHCSNAIAVLNNVYRSLKCEGILIFGESFATDRQLRGNDKCHPIQPTKVFLEEYLDEFSSMYLLEPTAGEQVIGIINGGARQSLYAIARKRKTGRSGDCL